MTSEDIKHQLIIIITTSPITQVHFFLYPCHQGNRPVTATSHGVKLYISDHTGTFLHLSGHQGNRSPTATSLSMKLYDISAHTGIFLHLSVSPRKQVIDSYITWCETLHLWSHRNIFFSHLCHQGNRSSTVTSHSVKLYISAHTCTLLPCCVSPRKLNISDHTGTFSPFICHQGNGSVTATSHGVKLYTSYHTGTFLSGSARVKWK